MKSSTTSSWESNPSQKLLGVPERTEEEDLISNSTRELVEFTGLIENVFQDAMQAFQQRYSRVAKVRISYLFESIRSY